MFYNEVILINFYVASGNPKQKSPKFMSTSLTLLELQKKNGRTNFCETLYFIMKRRKKINHIRHPKSWN